MSTVESVRAGAVPAGDEVKRTGVVPLLRQAQWSPYLAGAVLGLLYVATVAVSGRLLGASGAFENLVGLVVQSLLPELARGTYFRVVMPPGITWQVVVLAGIVVGAFISARLSGTFRLAAVPDAQWRRVFGTSLAKRWLVAFLGGIVVEYGAGLAGGCTSGLAVGGGLLLAPAAFVFMTGMFASGIPTALIAYRRRY